MTLPGFNRLRAGPDADLSHLPIALDLRAVNLAEGVRAALAVAVLFAINEWTGIPAIAEAALGAMLTCFCDPGGPVRRRVRPMTTMAIVGSLFTAGFSLLRQGPLLEVALIASLVILCTSFVRVWGQAALQTGNVLTVVIVLALDRPAPLPTAMLLGGMFLAGSLWALLLTLVIWVLHPYRPSRRATAEVFRRLATLTADLSEQVAREAVPDWAAHARAHRRYVRDGIEAARAAVLEAIRGRGQASPGANALLIQVEAADQLFGALIALSDVLETAGRQACETARPMLSAMRLLLAAISDAILDEHKTEDADRHAVFLRLIDQVSRAEADPALAGIVEAIIQRTRIAALLSTPEGLAPAQSEGGAGSASWLVPLRANLTWSSVGLRHATRAAVVALPALLITLSSGETYAHWLTLTLVLTLQPFFALTWQRALERIVGTLLGGIVAAAIAAFVHTPLATAAALFPLTVFAFSVRWVGFGLFMAAMTPIVVLLSEIGQPGASEFAIAAWRAAYTALGGIMAVLGGMLLWPSWEPNRLRQELKRALEAHAAFADLALAARMGESTPGLDAARRAAGLTTNNLEASLSRALQEPGHQSRADLHVAMVADAALRRMAGRLSVLQYEPSTPPDLPRLQAWRRWLDAGFLALETGAALPGPPPPAQPDGSLARIARQMDLIAGAQHPEDAAPQPTPSRQAAPSA